MLAEGGGSGGGGEGSIAHLVGEAGGKQIAVADAERSEPVAGGELLARGDVGHGVHGRDGDPQLLGRVIDLLLRAGLRPLAEGFQHLPKSLGPDERLLQRLVLQQVEALDEDEEVGVGREVEEEDEAIGAGHKDTAAAALDDALVRPDGGEPGVVVEDGLLVGNLNALALAPFASVPEARESADGGVRTRVEGHLVAGEGEGLSLGVAGEVVVAAGCVLGEGARLPAGTVAAAPVGGEGEDDRALVGGLDAGFEAIGGVPALAVDDDIGVSGELLDAGIVEGEGDAQLARGQPGEEGALAIDQGEFGAGGVAVEGFDLDDLGAEVGEQASAVGAGDARGEARARQRRRGAAGQGEGRVLSRRGLGRELTERLSSGRWREHGEDAGGGLLGGGSIAPDNGDAGPARSEVGGEGGVQRLRVGGVAFGGDEHNGAAALFAHELAEGLGGEEGRAVASGEGALLLDRGVGAGGGEGGDNDDSVAAPELAPRLLGEGAHLLGVGGLDDIGEVVAADGPDLVRDGVHGKLLLREGVEGRERDGSPRLRSGHRNGAVVRVASPDGGDDLSCKRVVWHGVGYRRAKRMVGRIRPMRNRRAMPMPIVFQSRERRSLE